jgi:long-chain fatty acid transport protein
MMIGGTCGEGVTYDFPRINPALLREPDGLTPIDPSEAYDTSSFLLCIKAVPAVSYEVNDRLSVGAGLLVDVVLFSADLAVPGPVAGTFVQTAGRGRAEVSYLMGFQVGVLYDFNERWSAGISYASRQWQLDDFSHYEDLIPGFELPPQLRCGVACQVADWLQLTADYKFIGWENIGLFGRLPTQGGFGWRNQHTVGLGAQAWLSERLIARAGWNYGRSPIDSDVIFVNGIFPVIYEHHLACGLELRLGDHHALALSAVGVPYNSMVDDGTGLGGGGAGLGIDFRSFDMDATWTIKF